MENIKNIILKIYEEKFELYDEYDQYEYKPHHDIFNERHNPNNLTIRDIIKASLFDYETYYYVEDLINRYNNHDDDDDDDNDDNDSGIENNI